MQARAKKNTNNTSACKRSGGSVDITRSLNPFGTDVIQKLMSTPYLAKQTAGDGLKLQLGNFLKSVMNNPQQVEQYGAATNMFLDTLTPQGAKKLSKLLTDASMFTGGKPVTSYLTSFLGQNAQTLQNLLASPVKGGGQSTIADKFLDQISAINKQKLALAAGVTSGGKIKGGSIASDFVESLMTEGGYEMLSKHFTNIVPPPPPVKTGGNIESYDKLFKKTMFEEYNIKNIAKGGATKNGSRRRKGGEVSDKVLDAAEMEVNREYPNTSSIRGFPGKHPFPTETVEMVKVDMMTDSVLARSDQIDGVMSTLTNSSAGLAFQFGGKKSSKKDKMLKNNHLY